MREHESAVKRQRRVKTLLKHFAGKAARGLEGKWKEGEALDSGLEAALARELPEGIVFVRVFKKAGCSVYTTIRRG